MSRLLDVPAVVVFSDAPRRLADWYRAVFTLAEVVSSEHFIGLRADGVTLFIQRSSEGHRPGRGGIRPHFAVQDCRATFDGLLAAGAQPILAVTDTGNELVAALEDPEGNPIGLLGPKR